MTDKRITARLIASAAASAFAALLCGCLLGPRAGTSTTTENTIAGVARLADGSVAAGASVSARSPDISLAKGDIPLSRVLATTTAGTDGAFSLTLAGKDGFFLEIEAVVADSASVRQDPGIAAADHSEIWFREFAWSKDKLTTLGDVDLEPASIVSGRLEADSNWAGQSVWIGVSGTGRFTRLDFPAKGDSSVAFILDRVPPGDNPLVLVVPGETGVSTSGLLKPHVLGTATVAPGASRDLGTLKLPLSD